MPTLPKSLSPPSDWLPAKPVNNYNKQQDAEEGAKSMKCKLDQSWNCQGSPPNHSPGHVREPPSEPCTDVAPVSVPSFPFKGKAQLSIADTWKVVIFKMPGVYYLALT